jgi:hypothetical protein
MAPMLIVVALVTPELVVQVSNGPEEGLIQEFTPDNIFIQFQSESQVDLLSNAGTPISGIMLFHLDNSLDDFFGPGFLPPRGQ